MKDLCGSVLASGQTFCDVYIKEPVSVCGPRSCAPSVPLLEF